MIKILLVAGARPNFIKAAPLIKEIKKYPKRIRLVFVHTGQHYGSGMSGQFIEGLRIPKPNIHLGIGSAPHGSQTAKIIEGIEKILLKVKFDLVIVVGDVNSTLAAALAAVKLNVKVAHVEAGLRSFDKTMPEEINRVLVDHMSDFLFTTEEQANKNLLKEGVPPSKIFFAGNILVDSYCMSKERILKSKILKELRLKDKQFCLVTMHRPSNVDEDRNLKRIIDILHAVNKKIKVVFPLHPRTEKMLKKYKLKLINMVTTKPLGYSDFHKLLMSAKLVITDSGGLQEEATVLNIPCLTLRATTERPVTITKGTNKLIGLNRTKVIKSVDKIINGRWKKALRPPKWDGKTAQRIVGVLLFKTHL